MVKKDIETSFSASLVLPKIIAHTLGFNDQIEIIDMLKEDNGDYSFTSDKSNYLEKIQEYFDKINIPEPFNILSESQLKQYDLNIKECVDIITSKRDISIKVYQYVALLFTEIYLDLYFNAKTTKDLDQFISFLNRSLDKINIEAEIESFKEEDLGKLCFWMATGSGKTIIMHINYLQYLNYIKKYSIPLNKTILITPNEDLSDQHIREFRKSDIEAIKTTKENYKLKKDSVKVIDINKLSEKSQVKRIDYKSFGDNNLILVDEGHRGGSGYKWINYRKNIAKEGFTFEYSATFQDIKKDKNEISDYKKTILFDYSYKYYHEDGYGKEYFISNVDFEKDDEYPQTLIMLGNLISFYEQKRLFLEHRHEVENNLLIEEPLWILVGSKVVETNKDKLDEGITSDILKFIRFLNQLKIEKEKYSEYIKNIFEDKTQLKNKGSNQSFFIDKFPYVRQLLRDEFNNNFQMLLADIFRLVLYADYNNAELVLENIKSSDGEIGLKYNDSTKYFGLIYVGKGNDAKIINSDFIKKNNIPTRDQVIKTSLFETLNKKDKDPLNILVGAKKFIEGWDNYRISSMLLMNFAKSKGVSAIQLFGRGVRLHGTQNSMKRSSFTNPHIERSELRKNLELLETLNVFGINASYMEEFRNELMEDIDFYIEREILVEKDPKHIIKHDLKCIKKEVNTEESFRTSKIVVLSTFPSVSIDIDNHLSVLKSKETQEQVIVNKIYKSVLINEEFFELVRWENIISELRRLKRIKDYRNLDLPDVDKIKDLLKNKIEVDIRGDEESFKQIKDWKILRDNLERIYIEILTKFINKNYSVEFKKHYSKNLRLVDLKEEMSKNDDDSIVPSSFKIKIYVDSQRKLKESKSKRLMEIFLESDKILDIRELDDILTKNLIQKDGFYMDFDRHIYFPLIIASKEEGVYTVTPPGMNEGEKKFLEHLKLFLDKNTINNYEVIVLRNHENTGYGYYLETKTYYPDFIMWAVKENEQIITFLDPKGLGHPDYEKIDFNNEVNKIENDIRQKNPEQNIKLHSFIVTETPKKIMAPDLVNNSDAYNIYFIYEAGYLEKIFKKIGIEFIRK